MRPFPRLCFILPTFLVTRKLAQGAVLSDEEQNRNETVAPPGKRAPGKKVAGKAERDTKDIVGRLSCPVFLGPGGHSTTAQCTVCKVEILF